MAFVYNPDPFAEPTYTAAFEEYKVTTGKYTFLVRQTEDVLNIGGKDKKCVQIGLSAKKLIWLESNRSGKCEVNGLSITGDATVLMAQLAMTILRTRAPEIQELVFEDASSFPCAFPDGTTRSVNLNIRDALIYGHTFYERKFSAVSLEQTTMMQTFRKNRLDPLKKPMVFQFNSTELQKLLGPIYDQCTTWAEFMHSLYLRYGSRDICKYIYPWYKSAFNLLSGSSEPPFDWKLNVWLQPDVPYEKIEHVSSGGYWTTILQPLQKAVFNGGSLLEMPYFKPSVKARKTYRRRRS